MEFGKDGQPVREGFQGATAGGTAQQPSRVINGGAGGTIIDATPAPQPPIEEAQTAPPPPVDQFPITVKLLYRPIRGNNQEELRSLTFREPTGGDINRCGNPCRVNAEGDVIIDEKKMTLIMANLSGVLSPLLDRMDPRDWNSCAYRLRGFFLPDLAAW